MQRIFTADQNSFRFIFSESEIQTSLALQVA